MINFSKDFPACTLVQGCWIYGGSVYKEPMKDRDFSVFTGWNNSDVEGSTVVYIREGFNASPWEHVIRLYVPTYKNRFVFTSNYDSIMDLITGKVVSGDWGTLMNCVDFCRSWVKAERIK